MTNKGHWHVGFNTTGLFLPNPDNVSDEDTAQAALLALTGHIGTFVSNMEAEVDEDDESIARDEFESAIEDASEVHEALVEAASFFDAEGNIDWNRAKAEDSAEDDRDLKPMRVLEGLASGLSVSLIDQTFWLRACSKSDRA